MPEQGRSAHALRKFATRQKNFRLPLLRFLVRRCFIEHNEPLRIDFKADQSTQPSRLHDERSAAVRHQQCSLMFDRRQLQRLRHGKRATNCYVYRSCLRPYLLGYWHFLL